MQKLLPARFIVFVFFISLSTFCVSQTDTSSPQIPAIVNGDPQWDWVRLDSGEWLKGEVISMDRDSLSFDSDNLGDVTIDWEDVRALYTYRSMAVLLVGGQKAQGQLVIDNEQIYIGNINYPVPIDDILRITLLAPNEIDLWRGSVAVGLSLRSGNVEERDLDSSARFTRRTTQTTYRISYTGNYTENDDVESANDHRVTTNFDYRLSQRWYLQPLRAEYYRDVFQNIEEQWQVGFGANYYALETNEILWTIAAGPGYQETTYFEVPEGSDRKVSSTTFLISTEYDHELTSNIDLYGKYDITYAKEESGGVTQNLTVALDVDLIGDFDLRVAATVNHIESPQADGDGNVPDNTDSRLTVGLSYDL